MKDPLTTFGIVAGVSLTLYVGSYLIVVVPTFMQISINNGPSRPLARCRFGGAWAPSIYLPLVILDERLFPKRWEKPEQIL